MTQRKAGSETVNYTYWTTGNGQMSLKSMSNGTWTKSYGYDNLGRVTEETMSKGTAFTRSRSYTYGSNGLIASRTLPGGMVYSYSYDAYGNLNGIDMGPGIVGWSSAGYTGRRTTAETVLNGDDEHPFFRTIALDGYGLPDSIITLQRWGQSYCHYQAEDYGFSPQTGNLMYRSGIVGGGYPQQYTYDTADRLTLVQEDNQTIMTMTYAQNGNILSKTGMGSYTYGSSSRPHAVTEVDNTDGSITLQVQDVGFNYWNKMSSVWATDENNFYSYSVDYGPDLRRVSSEMHRTYQKLYEKFYWDDYEEKVEGSDTLRYYYLNGANGLEALHIVKTSPNAQPVSQTTKVVTDHLGSITALIDESDYAYIARYRYDAWGNREIVMPYWFDLTFDRGYTGHEHLEMLGLINMNGRMYDPLLGRFLSPDPYIQAPTDPQNFNRYSYCLNNPLKYTDQDGEFFMFATILGATMNLVWQGASGNINSPSDAFWAMGIGAVSSIIGGYAGSAVLSALGQASSMCGAIGYGALSGTIGGGVSGSIAGCSNAIMNNDDLVKGMWQGALYGAASGILFGGISGGVEYFQFKKGCNNLGIEQDDPLPVSDDILSRAQKAWYPKAPMDQVKAFTVENVPESNMKSMIENTALGMTVPDYVDGTKIMSGCSKVYFNPAAFEHANKLFYTMGHELVHVSQINAMVGCSNYNVILMDYWAYDFQNSIGGGSLIGPETRSQLLLSRYNLYGLSDMETMNWTHFNWVNDVKFIYPF